MLVLDEEEADVEAPEDAEQEEGMEKGMSHVKLPMSPPCLMLDVFGMM